MDSVYQMLTVEQRKLRDKKSFFHSLVQQSTGIVDGKPGALQVLKSELSAVREAYDKLRKDVRSVVEIEVKAALNKATKNIDYPRQIDNKKTERPLDDHLKKREKELNDREKDLYEWETSLFQKNLQIEEMFEQYSIKMNKMATQKTEIQ